MGRARFRKGRFEGQGRTGMVLMAGGAAAAVILSIPNGLLEIGAASSGLSEMVPAAAPPLGTTARLLLAGVSSIAAMGLVMAIQRPRAAAPAVIHLSDGPAPSPAASSSGVSKMGFAFSKLTDFARGRSRGNAMAGVMPRRSEDAHPDAPPRRPIFASEDFGGTDIFGRPAEPRATEQRSVESQTAAGVGPMTMPVIEGVPLGIPLAGPTFNANVQQVMAVVTAPTPMPVASMPEPAIFSAPPPVPSAAPVAPPVAPLAAIAPAPIVNRPAPAVSAPLPRRPVEGLSLTELADRFEAGLGRQPRIVTQAPASVQTPAAPVASIAPVAVVAPVVAEPIIVVEPAPVAPTLAQMPPAQPVHVQPMLDAQIDEQLRAALGTLQKMTARAR